MRSLLDKIGESRCRCGRLTHRRAQTLASIGDIFKRARAIQRWLSQCAKLVCRSLPPTRLTGAAGEDTTKMVPMVWTTPLKLPVTQPYRLAKRRQVSTVLQSIALDDPHTVNEVDTRSQATAFPPNYIHSLDATHMMLTAMECKKEGIVFASVHDSFWTHPCDVDVMSAMLRKSFIELHTQPLLEKLRADVS
jgi:DNA-directed RNA polymerase